MGYLDNTVGALLEASGSIDENNQYYAAILANVDSAMAHLNTASNDRFVELKRLVAKLRQDLDTVHLFSLNVSHQIEEKAVALDNGL